MAEAAPGRGLPRTLAGRVLLIIIAGLVVAHVTSYVLFEVERGRSLERYTAAELAMRIVDGARASPAAMQAPLPPRAVGAPLGRPRIRWQDVEALGEPPAGGEAAPSVFAAELRRSLAEALGSDPVSWLALREVQRPAPEGGMPGGPERVRNPMLERTARMVTVALKLPDGRQALVESPLFLPTHQIPTEAWISIALIFVVTTLFSIWAVRIAVRPVRMLADAAERLSRNIDEPPLPEKGAVEIRAATRAFNRMQDRLRRHVHGRALAFAAMSHDIRTPLTRMRLRLESLGDEARDKLAGDVGEIEAIAKSALDVTRGLSHEESVVPVELRGLVARLLQDYSALGHHVAVSGVAEPVDARPAALRRAIGNLVDNALKYGTQVEVAIEDAREHASVSVRDRGPGIPPEHLPKVVNPFYRVESSRNRGTGGTGLGLAIAKDIAEGHGGELMIDNREGGGLCATLRLPR
jgi:signal transduction histidine kinase